MEIDAAVGARRIGVGVFDEERLSLEQVAIPSEWRRYLLLTRRIVHAVSRADEFQ